jgi:hypothetical protein
MFIGSPACKLKDFFSLKDEPGTHMIHCEESDHQDTGTENLRKEWRLILHGLSNIAIIHGLENFFSPYFAEDSQGLGEMVTFKFHNNFSPSSTFPSLYGSGDHY